MIWDPVRRLWVAATPEEKVRQQWIHHMIQELGYPPALLAVEKDLSALAPRSAALDPRRRIDLVCFTGRKGELRPLLLLECKAGMLGERAIEQIWGYNELLSAPFLCLVNATEATTFWKEQGRIASAPFLPSYAQLTAAL